MVLDPRLRGDDAFFWECSFSTGVAKEVRNARRKQVSVVEMV
ncbi:MAG: hypothetical protein BWY06_00491 [Candidatus Latescibacteria bacterium ADurb.Bin168]|nr:MAG: hypothetical protein BWY06_00491 [Candidatus Latescibacteria bacterium ADurb.Bin168]